VLAEADEMPPRPVVRVVARLRRPPAASCTASTLAGDAGGHDVGLATTRTTGRGDIPSASASTTSSVPTKQLVSATRQAGADGATSARDALARAGSDALNGAVIGVHRPCHMARHASRLELSTARLYFPLARLALCADCEVCFESASTPAPPAVVGRGRPWPDSSDMPPREWSCGLSRAVLAEDTRQRRARGERTPPRHRLGDQPKLY